MQRVIFELLIRRHTVIERHGASNLDASAFINQMRMSLRWGDNLLRDAANMYGGTDASALETARFHGDYRMVTDLVTAVEILRSGISLMDMWYNQHSEHTQERDQQSGIVLQSVHNMARSPRGIYIRPAGK